MSSEPKLSKGYSQYGADMGRRDTTDCDAETPILLSCYRMRLDSGGYDNGGAYWGSGAPLFRVTGDHSSEFGIESLELFIRASSRSEAIAIVRKQYPNARFYGERKSANRASQPTVARKPSYTRYKYAPSTVSIHVAGFGLYADAAVTRVTLEPPVAAATHADSAIRGECYLLSLHTAYGAVQYGVARGRIDATLRMQVELYPGTERNEILALWEDAPAF